MIIYKALTKAEFAEDAGISASTLRQWIKEQINNITPLGYRPRCKTFSPSVVKVLAEHYCVMPRNAQIV